jgi:signal-transduction protein with cAMP-binding, CBS, and nucleotidyltransferase domain
MSSSHPGMPSPPKVGAIADRTFITLDENTIVAVAAKTLYDTEGCSIIVTQNQSGKKGRYPIGIVTERDIIFRVVAQNKGSFKVTLGQIMSSPLVTIDKNASLNEALMVMKRNKINRLPVIDSGGAIIGLLTMEMLVRKVHIKTIARS